MPRYRVGTVADLTRLLFAEPSPAPIKHWLSRTGLIDSAEVRLPMAEVSAELAARLDREIERCLTRPCEEPQVAGTRTDDGDRLRDRSSASSQGPATPVEKSRASPRGVSVLNAEIRVPNNSGRKGLRIEPARDLLQIFLTELVTRFLLFGRPFLVGHLEISSD